MSHSPLARVGWVEACLERARDKGGGGIGGVRGWRHADPRSTDAQHRQQHSWPQGASIQTGFRRLRKPSRVGV